MLSGQNQAGFLPCLAVNFRTGDLFRFFNRVLSGVKLSKNMCDLSIIPVVVLDTEMCIEIFVEHYVFMVDYLIYVYVKKGLAVDRTVIFH